MGGPAEPEALNPWPRPPWPPHPLWSSVVSSAFSGPLQPSMVSLAFSGPLQPSVVSLAFFILCSTTCHLAAQPAQGRLPVSGRGRG